MCYQRHGEGDSQNGHTTHIMKNKKINFSVGSDLKIHEHILKLVISRIQFQFNVYRTEKQMFLFVFPLSVLISISLTNRTHAQ